MSDHILTITPLLTLEKKADIADETELNFSPINAENMPQVWRYLSREPGRTCDFSYGGVLMWVEMFHYEMTIVHDTLFIKGRLENDLRKVAFSLPIGSLPLRKSLSLLTEYCRKHRLELRFSALPEYCLDSFMALNPRSISLLEDWGDYLYDIAPLASLAGKKMAKKRNHVNQYLHTYGENTYEPLTAENLSEVQEYMHRLSHESAPTADAARERSLTAHLLSLMEHGEHPFYGGMLRIDGEVKAFTIGDIKGDTLFIHVEKADREVSGSYEMINTSFARHMLNAHPELKYINREDDGGDPGLRKAKLSYHPRTVLKKYNVIF